MSLSLALIGCGSITRTHARTLSRFGSRVRLAFASRDAARAESFRRECKGFAAFGEYAAAFADPRIDAVLVATPPAQHLALTLEALAAGKQVIVEKPAFLHSDDVAQVEAAALQAGRQVLVAENYAYKPLTRMLSRLLDAGEIGAPRLVRLSALKYQATPDWRGSPALAGGGALFEGGIHWVNLLAALGPEIVDVRGYRPSGGAEPERTMVVVVRYANGALGTLHHSWEAPARLKGISLSQIIGEKGTLVFESNGLFVLLNGARRRLLFPGFRDIKGFRAMFDDFLTALATGRAPRMTLAAARRDLAVVETAYRTATQD
ncbi:MAG TPA: Gfo/Idh/MocA family oxidoreductase [Gemmatimonadales bacterium]|nr:Gfo/Idh/MocA family oxidoreductase [Gemmatimonadales bacterium]